MCEQQHNETEDEAASNSGQHAIAMFLIQLLLPTHAPRDIAIAAAFKRTRQELVDKFSGVTAYLRGTAEGVWIAPDGEREQDDVVMVEVLADTFDHAWWRAYGKELAVRFGQEEIHIRALPAEQP
jgi:hypothetical protein